MKHARSHSSRAVLWAMLKADFIERARRSSFLVTICLVIYLGYAVNAGTILIKLGTYRGIYNSAWVGSLMALVITFFLGITGFYLVKNSIERDERTGVGQIIATTPLTRPQYLVGKWLSNFTVLATLVGILALAAILMQVIQREATDILLWPLLAPFLLIALPMMALVAAFAVLFESIPWLKGGFGNLVYFGVFMTLFMADIFLTDLPWLDVTGVSLVGGSMKAAAYAAFPDYKGSFTLAMVSEKALDTFVWSGLNWTAGLVAQRLLWLPVSLLVTLAGTLFFNRFDPSLSRAQRGKQHQLEGILPVDKTDAPPAQPAIHLTPLPRANRFHFNFLHLTWLEILLLVKGLKWYWLAGMAGIWIGGLAATDAVSRNMWFNLAAIWPVLIWSRMGERETRWRTEQLVNQAAFPLLRLPAPAWLAGVAVTALATSGVLAGRLLAGEPAGLAAWLLSVLFIPTLAYVLGTWGRTSKLFEVIYPIWWYLGPFNRENGLAAIDYLGIHQTALVNTAPLWVIAFIVLLLALALLGRRQQAACV